MNTTNTGAIEVRATKSMVVLAVLFLSAFMALCYLATRHFPLHLENGFGPLLRETDGLRALLINLGVKGLLWPVVALGIWEQVRFLWVPMFVADEHGVQVNHLGGPQRARWEDVAAIRVGRIGSKPVASFDLRPEVKASAYWGLWKSDRILLKLVALTESPEAFFDKLARFPKAGHLMKNSA